MDPKFFWLLVALLGCTATTPSAPDAAPDAAPDVAPDVAPDRVEVATVDALDAAREDVIPGGPCVLNRECPAETRCACVAGECRCTPGPRGTGIAGESACTSGDDCASSLCVDGTAGMRCSDACETARDCPAALPRCVRVGALGISLCARDPNARPDGGTTETNLDAVFGSRRGNFDRAQHGRAGANGIYVEAHFGGDPACPGPASPTPRRTLVIAGLRSDFSAVQTEASGVRATLLDFGGDLVSAPTLRAMRVEVTPQRLEPGTRVRFEIRAVFAGGEIRGTLDAPWCASLDG